MPEDLNAIGREQLIGLLDAVRRQRDLLANSIFEASIELGIAADHVRSSDGPMALMLLEHIKEMAAEPRNVRGLVALEPNLVERCREIVGWHRTGILKGDALRSFASTSLVVPDDDPNYLRMAEEETVKELLSVAITAEPGRIIVPLEWQPDDHDEFDHAWSARTEHVHYVVCGDKGGWYLETFHPTHEDLKRIVPVETMQAGFDAAQRTHDAALGIAAERQPALKATDAPNPSNGD